MEHGKKYVDLHIHSTYSDGQFSPTSLVEMAKKNNVGTISITDHDDIRSIFELNLINDNSINFINGVELSSVTNVNGRKKVIHILGYDFDENSKILNEALLHKSNIRSTVNKEYLKNMLEKFDFISSDILDSIEYDKYIRFTRLIEKYINSKNFTKEQLILLQEFLQQNKLIYPKYEFSDEEAIKLINDANGIAVLAHPYQYHLTIDEENILLQKLINFGLKGLEIAHSGDTQNGMIIQEQFAKKFHLLESVGSDFHTDYDDFGNEIGYGKNSNLCREDCSILRKIRK